MLTKTPSADRSEPPGLGLVAAAVAAQTACIAVPNLWSMHVSLLVSGGLLAAGCMLFSVRRTLVALVLLTVALPVKVLFALVLPGGFRFQEGLLAAAILFALIDLAYCRGLRLRPSAADLPVFVFLLVTALSTAVGLARGHDTSQILRDARFPLYYGVFFLVTNFVDGRFAVRVLLPALALAALAVSAEYILEFLGAIDLSTGTRFVRVSRLQGLGLPLVLLFIVNQLVHDPRRYGRTLLVGLMLPIGLAFVLTVGRGMWVAVGVGLSCTVLAHYFQQPAARRSVWRAALLLLGIVAAVVGTAFAFQTFTGAAIGAHALERSLTFVDLGRDAPIMVRLLSYSAVVETIRQQLLIGNGQGATIHLLSLVHETGLPYIVKSWTVDSLYLALLWKMGLVGLVAFGWMALRLLRLAYRTFKSAQDPQVRAFAGGAVAIFVGMAVLGISDASMVNGRFAVVFGTIFGMVAAVARDVERGRV